jgi:glycosyltransferase involved in cell wall biosynthesis
LIYKVRKIKRQYKIDVSISFAEQANIINILTRGKGRTVISMRTLLSKEIASTPRMKILTHLIKRLYNKAEQIIVPSQLGGLDLQKHFGIAPVKLKVIYNYIEPEKINALAIEAIDDPLLNSLFARPVLLNVGRITRAKGQWLLFDIMKTIKPLHPEWKLVIIGESDSEGNLKSDLHKLSNQLGLKLYDSATAEELSTEYDIYLLGFRVNPFKYMRHSSVLVFPSVFEGFPNTVLEAMQCKLPVIVADCNAGPREILAPKSDFSNRTVIAEWTDNGILCPALPFADINIPVSSSIIDEWVYAINQVISDRDLRERLVRNGLRRVRDFDKTEILNEWEKSINGRC